jgi:hypothetical protein
LNLGSIKQIAMQAVSAALSSLPKIPPSVRAACAGALAGAALGPVGALAGAALGKVVQDKFGTKTDIYSKGIQMKGNGAFIKDAKASLDRLNATPTGKSLLESIGTTGKVATITKFNDSNGTCTPQSLADAIRKADGSPGSGSDSLIKFNPNFKPGGIPNEVILGHELMHAQHNATGTHETGKTGGVKNEELRTSGLPPYPESGLTENALRKDLGQPRRNNY